MAGEKKFTEYLYCIDGWLVDKGRSKLSLEEKKLIIESLQKIEDKASYTEVGQLRTALAVEAARVGSIILLGVLPISEMEIELDKIAKRVVEAKKKYLQVA